MFAMYIPGATLHIFGLKFLLGRPDPIHRIGIGADLGIFPLIGMGNFERGSKHDFFCFFF